MSLILLLARLKQHQALQASPVCITLSVYILTLTGIVASTDKYLSQFPAALSVQTGRQEMIDDIGILLKSRLELWKKKNNQALPENILVYRDGVSEGQYDIVRLTELPAIQKACSEVYPTTQTKQGLPRMTVIIVGKRHHTRFYPTTDQPNLSDTRSGNPKNGTVVDRGVTEARTWEYVESCCTLREHSLTCLIVGSVRLTRGCKGLLGYVTSYYTLREHSLIRFVASTLRCGARRDLSRKEAAARDEEHCGRVGGPDTQHVLHVWSRHQGCEHISCSVLCRLSSYTLDKPADLQLT